MGTPEEHQPELKAQNLKMTDPAGSKKADDAERQTTSSDSDRRNTESSQRSNIRHLAHVYLSVGLLFVNYFLAQYDKFILSYFQSSVLDDLSLSAPQYALLSGYSTGIAYAVLALPVAFVADYTRARVWTLCLTAAWWSLCVVFQGLAHNFWQIFCARLGMGIGQAAVEALSVSLISDLVGWRNVFLGESVFYVGVYVGEAVSGQIATAFTATDTSWQLALRAIGITGLVVALFLRLVLREPQRQMSLVQAAAGEAGSGSKSATDDDVVAFHPAHDDRLQAARADFVATVEYLVRMRSFWLILLSAGMRQLAGNVFGYYMPSYLAGLYPSETKLLSRYGIIVGTVGSASVLAGGAATSLLWHRTKLTPIYLTAVGGMVSSIFVLLMVFSKNLAGGDDERGVKILYGTMSAAYLTAEMWLGSLFALVALLLPPAYKTFGLVIWGSVQVLIYSSGPEIVGLALRNSEPGSDEYSRVTRTVLATVIVAGYWLCGIGLLLAIPLLKRDLNRDFAGAHLSKRRKSGFSAFAAFSFTVVVVLFTLSLVYRA